MRKNLEAPKDKKGKVKDGLHEIGQICVDSGQIGITDPCRTDFDLTVSTNFGDGLFPVYEEWENNKRMALVIPLSTDVHDLLGQALEEKKWKNLDNKEFGIKLPIGEKHPNISPVDERTDSNQDRSNTGVTEKNKKIKDTEEYFTNSFGIRMRRQK